MCEGTLLNTAKNGDVYDFMKSFEKIKTKLSSSNLVIGNFESVLTGKDYTAYPNVFRTPDTFAKAIKHAGIDILTTVNNHSLDGGLEGVRRTHRVLQNMGFEVIGTMPERQDNYLIIETEIGRVAFLAYTESLNNIVQDDFMDIAIEDYINLLCPLPTKKELLALKRRAYTGFSGSVKYIISRMLSFKYMKKVKKWLHSMTFSKRKPTVPFQIDQLTDRHQNKKFLESIKNDVLKAKANSDFVFACCHAGGQYNQQPGTYLSFLRKFFRELGITAFIGNHPHVIQKADFHEYDQETEQQSVYSEFNSLGSIIQTIDGYRQNDPALPEYSLAAHYYFNYETKQIEIITFSILGIIVDETRYQYVYPLEDIVKEFPEKKQKIKQDIMNLLNRIHSKEIFLDQDQVEIKSEYDFFIRTT